MCACHFASEATHVIHDVRDVAYQCGTRMHSNQYPFEKPTWHFLSKVVAIAHSRSHLANVRTGSAQRQWCAFCPIEIFPPF